MFLFFDQKPPEDIPQFLADSDLAYLSFADNQLFNMTIPAKLQSYIACGIPVLAAAGGETKEIIKKSKAGFCKETGNEKKLADSIVKFINMSMKERKQMENTSRI